MKVKDLKLLLKDLDDNFLVVVSCDSEGNEYSPLADGGLSMYEAETTWSGYCRCKEDVEEDGEEYRPNALVLYPTN